MTFDKSTEGAAKRNSGHNDGGNDIQLRHGFDYYVGPGTASKKQRVVFTHPGIIDLIQDPQAAAEGKEPDYSIVVDDMGYVRAIDVLYRDAFEIGRRATDPLLGGEGVEHMQNERMALTVACLAIGGILGERAHEERMRTLSLVPRPAPIPAYVNA